MLSVNRDAQLQWQTLFHSRGCSFSPLFHWCLSKKLDKLILVRTAIGWEVILPITKGCVTFGLVCFLENQTCVLGTGWEMLSSNRTSSGRQQ